MLGSSEEELSKKERKRQLPSRSQTIKILSK